MKHYTTIQDKLNFETYNSKEAVNDYDFAISEGLQAPEEYILIFLKDKIVGKKILDIGIGAGRTTHFFANLELDYTGIDYSPAMIENAKKRFPNVKKLFTCDARNMELFQNESFDFVFFSFNGIDSVNHSDRILILKEIKRVLKPDSYFAFSSHNKLYYKKKFKFIYPRKNPRFFFKNLQGLTRFLNNKRKEIHTSDYSIVNDSGQNYKLLTYYITMDKQIEQLKNLDFSDDFFCVNRSGKLILTQENSKDSIWIYYCVKK